jgi:hypothetical protein
MTRASATSGRNINRGRMRNGPPQVRQHLDSEGLTHPPAVTGKGLRTW